MTVLVQVRRMSTAELKLALSNDEKNRVLIIDCRPFLAYNSVHISGSHNIHFPRILRRRSKGPLPLKYILTCPETREELLSGVYSLVVVYDEHSMELNGRDGDLQPVLETLIDEPVSHLTTEVCYLEGGFEKFSREHARLCSGSSQTEPTTNSMECKKKKKKVPPMLVLTPLPQRPLSCKPAFLTIPPCSGNIPSPSPSPMQISSLPLSAGPNYERADPVQILPHLYLGSVCHASRKEILDAHGITAIINVSNSCQNYFPDSFKYKHIAVNDDGEADLQSWFEDTTEFINSVKLCGGRVLIHCYAGISRSATVCLAYLMKSEHMRLEEAFEFVRKLRAVISPNLAFMLQLSKYETELQQKENTDVVSSSRRRFVGQFSLTAMDGIKKAKLSREMSLSFAPHSATAIAAKSCLTRTTSMPVVGLGQSNKMQRGNNLEGQKFVFNFGLNPPTTQFGSNWSSPQNSPTPICSPS